MTIVLRLCGFLTVPPAASPCGARNSYLSVFLLPIKIREKNCAVPLTIYGA